MRTHRIRRGQLVEIPERWRGRTTDRQTIRKRPSKLTKKLRRQIKRGYPDRAELLAPQIDEWEDTP